MMTDDELAAIRKRAETFNDYLIGRRDDVGTVAFDCLNAYRDDIPALLADVERLRGWRDIAEEHLSNQLALEHENGALRAEVQEGAEALLRTHRLLSAKEAENVALREIVQAVATADLQRVSLADAQRLILKARALLASEEK